MISLTPFNRSSVVLPPELIELCKNEKGQRFKPQISKLRRYTRKERDLKEQFFSYEFVGRDCNCVEFTATERPEKRDGGHGRESGHEGNLGEGDKLMLNP